MVVVASDHPVIKHKMTYLRDKKTRPADFRRLLREISFYLGYEASRDLSTKSKTVTTPINEEYAGEKLAEKVGIIPILRAGLQMSDALVELFPDSSVHHIGMYRTKESPMPIQYYNRLPSGQRCDLAIICDPCIASSNTLKSACSIVKKWGATRLVVIAAIGSRGGINALQSAHPDVNIYVGQIDEAPLTNGGMISPGIGDAGDRLFGTPDEDEEEEENQKANGKKRKH
jgi:uracil phosphoribosyltransferase